MKNVLYTAGILCMGLMVTSATDPAEPEKKPFLGVHVVGVPAPVRAQTELEEGAGLLVDFIVPGSPAEQAGVKPFDILTNLEDQKLLSGEQFTNLIRSAKTTAPINLSVLRKGKPVTLNVTLILAPPQTVTPTLPEGKELEDWLKQNNHPQPLELKTMEAASLSIIDQDGQVAITRKNGKQTALVKDTNGKILFDGPIDTAQERQVIPDEVRQRIEQLEQSAHAVKATP